MYIADITGFIYEADHRGQIIKTYSLPENMASYQMYRMDLDPGKHIVLWSQNYLELPLDNMPKTINLQAYEKGQRSDNGITTATGQKYEAIDCGFAGVEIRSKDGSVTIPVLANYGAMGGVRIIGHDNQGNIYVLVEELVDGVPVITVELTVRRYDKHGTMTGVAKLPLSEMASVPKQMIEVTKNGAIYFMTPTLTNVKIYEVTLSQSYNSEIPALKLKYAQDRNTLTSDFSLLASAGFKGFPICIQSHCPDSLHANV
jgi:hypothetical protein